jgi:hypothetical protein
VIDLSQLTQALVTTIQAIPEVPAYLANQDTTNVVGYLDANPIPFSLKRTVYEMKPGSILVAFEETSFNDQAENAMSMFQHRYFLYLRCAPGTSGLEMVNAVVNGTPYGSSERWRLCPVMNGVLPTNLLNVTRASDSEGIDYFAVLTETPEIGDA